MKEEKEGEGEEEEGEGGGGGGGGGWGYANLVSVLKSGRELPLGKVLPKVDNGVLQHTSAGWVVTESRSAVLKHTHCFPEGGREGGREGVIEGGREGVRE